MPLPPPNRRRFEPSLSTVLIKIAIKTILSKSNGIPFDPNKKQIYINIKLKSLTLTDGFAKLAIFWVAHCDDLRLLRPEAATVGCCRRQQHL